MTTTPKGLQAAGEALWSRVSADCELEAHEERLLLEACRVVDRLDALAAVIEDGGPMLGDRAHPALVEARQQELVLAKLLSSLALPEAGEEVGQTATQRRARKAAESRWGMERARRERRLNNG